MYHAVNMDSAPSTQFQLWPQGIGQMFVSTVTEQYDFQHPSTTSGLQGYCGIRGVGGDRRHMIPNCRRIPLKAH